MKIISEKSRIPIETRYRSKHNSLMKQQLTTLQNRLHNLGTVLLVVASLGLLSGLVIIPFSFFVTPDLFSFSVAEENPEIKKVIDEVDEMFFPEGVTLDTTVRELQEFDKNFFEKNLGLYRAVWL